MSLINAYEVRYFSPAGTNYDLNRVNSFIKVREQYLANKCLGWKFYEALIDDVISYAGTDYSETATYSTGDNVNDNSTGIVYTALSSIPAATPLSNTNYWEVAKKFSSTAYNNLWTGSLRDYLANSIYRASLTASTFRGTSQGVARQAGNGMEAATKDELSYTVTSMKETETEAYSNLADYLKRNAVALVWNGCDEDENCEAMRTKNLGFIF